VTVVLDIGNTRIKWARTAGAGLADVGSAVHRDSPEPALEALAAAFPPPVERVLASNVAGEVMASRLVTFAMERWGVEPQLVETEAEGYGVRCGYRDPARLGVDRWIAVIAARESVDSAACVIDAGTTVTLDVVDAEGTHLGGLIMPGPRIVAAALHAGTRNIGPTESVKGRPTGLALLGHTTEEAVGHGALLALAAGLDRAVGSAHPPRCY
jgi:type III pantothenate kinase